MQSEYDRHGHSSQITTSNPPRADPMEADSSVHLSQPNADSNSSLPYHIEQLDSPYSTSNASLGVHNGSVASSGQFRFSDTTLNAAVSPSLTSDIALGSNSISQPAPMSAPLDSSNSLGVDT